MISDFTFNFKADDNLPLELWTYLVKHRANFKCEDCGSIKFLRSHHFSPDEKNKGIHKLKHGICLCSDCHGDYTSNQFYSEPNIPYWRVNFILVYGFEKGKDLYLKFFSSKTKLEMIDFLKELELEGHDKIIELNLKVSYPSETRKDVKIDKPYKTYSIGMTDKQIFDLSITIEAINDMKINHKSKFINFLHKIINI
jgi:hypothetical protein